MSHDPHDNGPAGYERRDVHIPGLTAFFVSLMIFMVGALIIGVGLHKGYLYIERSRKADVSPLADLKRQPPAPRLQVDPTADMVHFRAIEEKALTTYGWVDKQQGVVRLPIDRAIELVAERGL